VGLGDKSRRQEMDHGLGIGHDEQGKESGGQEK